MGKLICELGAFYIMDRGYIDWARLYQIAKSGHGLEKTPVVDEEWCFKALSEKMESMNFLRLQEDVRRFLTPVELASLKLWSREFFFGRAAKLFQ